MRDKSEIIIAAAKNEKAGAGRALLAFLLCEKFGIDISEEKEPIGKEAYGKPFLNHHRDIFFNISHSGEYVVCAAGYVPMGIDIQYHKEIAPERIEKIAKKVLSESEWEVFEKAGHTPEAFYAFWTKKESFLKFTGDGIRMDLKKLDYKGGRFEEMNFREGYSGMICVPENWAGEIHHIFF